MTRPNQAEQLNAQSRRDFIKVIGIGTVVLPLTGFKIDKYTPVSIVYSPTDAAATSVPVQWAISQLTIALQAHGVTVNHHDDVSKVAAESLCIVAVCTTQVAGATMLKKVGVTQSIPAAPEALGLFPVNSRRQTIAVAGHDERGLIYALLELTDRVQQADNPIAVLHLQQPIIEQPANRVRSLNRLFVSDVEDKPWYNDRDMWPEYLSMAAAQRFNRFNLSFGIGYDFLQKVTDAYFLFAYPFLLSVPGYQVHVPELPDSERDNNLAMLKFISEQTARRGMEFWLGIWMHGHEWLNTTNANYNIKGIDKNNHAAYCRDALRLLLQSCPAIKGITFRIHGESGVNEGSYDFWKTVFDGIKTCGRPVQIDMHSKGIDEGMIETALSVGVPVTVSPKYWAEHVGMPYHQADIRALEIPNGHKRLGLMNLSEGSRSFTRYGYADLLKEGRKYDILTRLWPGTQRLLLWGDPLTAAAQSRIFSFCGSAGAELMEPLSFKGRRGSGIAGDRCGYADVSLKPKWDWEKYLYSLRVFGRTLYNPDTDADVWNRYLRKQFGAGGTHAKEALASASRILPTILTAHGASAGNNVYWPEMYSNMPITSDKIKSTYSDTPQPRVFGNVSPLDPQLFLSINDYAANLLTDKQSGKYSPVEVAQWLEDFASEATRHLEQMKLKSKNKLKPEYRRMVIDINLQVLLGRFFAAKMRAATLFAIYETTADRVALEQALQSYRQARQNWATMANGVKGIYKNDITAGEYACLRGHWLDRLPAIDEDVAAMAKILDEAPQQSTGNRAAATIAAVNKCLQKSRRMMLTVKHIPTKKFRPGTDIELTIPAESTVSSATLYYRHVNHAERYESIVMNLSNGNYKGRIPGSYTNSPYSIAYYFELNNNQQLATLYPGFGPKLTDQPYFIIRQG